MTIRWYHYVEFLSFILAAVFFSDLKKFKLGGFLPYLFLTCVTELIASNIEAFGLTNNHFVYDIYIVVASAITIYIYYPILNYKGLAQKLYIGLAALAIVFMLVDMFIIQGFVDYDTYNNTITAFIAVILATLLLVKLFMDDNATVRIIDNPYFWISAGAIIFYFGEMIVLGLQQFIMQRQIKVGGVILYNVIIPLFCAVLYGCFCYSFILCRKLTTRLLLS